MQNPELYVYYSNYNYVKCMKVYKQRSGETWNDITCLELNVS